MLHAMATELFLHGKPITSVFELLGHKENDITFSIGWAIAQSPAFRRALLDRVFGCSVSDDSTVLMQERVKGGGITDIEILGRDHHLVVEAKRGWEVPDTLQLELYLPRLIAESRSRAGFLTLSECNHAAVSHKLPPAVGGYPVTHLAWHEVQSLARCTGIRGIEKSLLTQLVRYLERVVKMQDKESNWVMTVALSNDKPAGYGLTFKEVVQQKRMYFHPISGNYSLTPVNYLGVRWDGFLQAIHHVESWEVVRDIHARIPELNPGEWEEPHYLYTLGPAIVPPKPVALGNLYAPGPAHAMFDLLLTCDTVAEARTKSNARVNQQGT